MALTTARATRVLAPNPGPMTPDGTNTWILAEPGADRAVVVDPGPLHEGHLQAVLAVAERRGSRVGLVLLTHGHTDHAEGAARLATLAGECPSGRSIMRIGWARKGLATATW